MGLAYAAEDRLTSSHDGRGAASARAVSSLLSASKAVTVLGSKSLQSLISLSLSRSRSRSSCDEANLGVANQGCEVVALRDPPGQDEEGSPRAVQEQTGNAAEGDWHVELRARSQWPRRLSRACIVLGISVVHGEPQA